MNKPMQIELFNTADSKIMVFDNSKASEVSMKRFTKDELGAIIGMDCLVRCLNSTKKMFIEPDTYNRIKIAM